MSHLSRAVSEKRSSEFLHSMASSKDIFHWTSRGQLLQNKRIIPVTNNAELVEYVLLPHNNDVTKPRALKTLLDGLAELGVYKGLIKNKKVAKRFDGKGKRLPNAENTSDSDGKGRYTLSDKLHQQVATTDHSVCTGLATNRFVCTGEIL